MDVLFTFLIVLIFKIQFAQMEKVDLIYTNNILMIWLTHFN